MPNWVRNELSVEGKPSALRSFFERCCLIRDEHGTESYGFDFERIIPVPETIRIVSGEEGKLADRAIALYRRDILGEELAEPEARMLGAMSPEELYGRRYRIFLDERKPMLTLLEAGKLYSENERSYGVRSRYDWNCTNWGTKWNACEAEVSPEDGFIVFETAWAAPFPIYRVLAEQFPDLRIHAEYADEDIGFNCGRIDISEGRCTVTSLPEGTEAVELACELWQEDPEEYRPAMDREPETAGRGVSWDSLVDAAYSGLVWKVHVVGQIRDGLDGDWEFLDHPFEAMYTTRAEATAAARSFTPEMAIAARDASHSTISVEVQAYEWVNGDEVEPHYCSLIIDFLPDGTVSPWEDPDDPSDCRQMFEDAARRQPAQKGSEPRQSNNPVRGGRR